jgi:ubiquitin-like protein Pup
MPRYEQRNSGGQEQKDSSEMSDEEVQAAQSVEAKHSDIDEVLDEIDGVLESNAEVFVRDFVQKGGQ